MKIHMIGIAGTGMGALAGLLKQAGHDVRGSDVGVYPPMSDQLRRAEIPVFLGYDAVHLGWGPDHVVVGNVCPPDHPEVLEAERRGLPLESFPSMLAKALLPGRESIVVAGTHGKTTTTTLVAWLLRAGELDPSFLIGGVSLNFGTGAHLGSGRPFVIEGDEYNTAFFDKGSKFLHYGPHRAVLTSVEHDHVDIFPTMDDVRAAFAAFIDTIDPSGDLVVAADQPEALALGKRARCNVSRYRVIPPRATGARRGPVSDDCEFIALMGAAGGRRTRFEVLERGRSLGHFSTHLVGEYNVANALAAIAIGRLEGIDADVLRLAIARFRGVKKRQELLGMAAGVRLFFDFAHHPTAVELTLRGLRKRYPDHALHACFEPRSSSSRRSEFTEAYAKAFDVASWVYIAPVFRPEKVPSGQLLDTVKVAQGISARGVAAKSYASIDALADSILERAVPGDTVVLMSSGDFGGLADKLLLDLGDPVTFATPEDGPLVQDLLDGYGLPRIVPSDDVETLVIRDVGGLAGCVSVMVLGTVAFLFGLAVAPARRGQGLGWVLGDIVLRRARTLGASRCYLLTNTATDFFAGKLGFSPVPASDVDPGLARSANFQASAELEGAVCMVARLTAGPDEL